MNNLYQEELIEHFKYPCNNKVIENPDFMCAQFNPSCGDKVSIMGKLDGDTITDIGFQGSGCVISQAAASMLTEECIGNDIAYAKSLDQTTIKNMVGLDLGPTRLKCALLCLHALHDALKNSEKK